MTAPERIWTAPTDGKCHVGFDTPSLNYTTEYIRANLAAVPAQVRVKPLVWEEPCYTNNWIHVARSVLGDYYISIDGGRHSAWLEANVKPYENKIGDDVGSAIEAMMLAETDYQARMQPLITPHPDPRDEVIARLVDALERLNAACDAMWNDDRRIEKINGYFTGQQPWQIKEAHMRSISEAQQRLPSAIAAAKAVQHG